MLDLTIIMPCRNSWRTLPQALTALGKAVNDTSAKLMLFVSDGDDPTMDIVRSETFAPTLTDLGLPDVQVLYVPRMRGNNARDKRYSALMAMWAMALERVKTEYLMRVDSDLIIPDRSVHTLMSAMRGNSRLGEIAIRYPHIAGGRHIHDHLTCGCTLFRTAALKEIAPIQRQRCDCLYISENLKARGWEAHLAPRLEAEHLV